MVQRRLRFALKSGQAVGIGMEVRRQNFDRDLATEFGIAGPGNLVRPQANR